MSCNHHIFTFYFTIIIYNTNITIIIFRNRYTSSILIYFNFLINYNGDANKTRDIKVTGADCKIVVNADLSVSIEYLEELETPEETEEPTTKEDVQETTTEQPATQAQTPSSNGLGPEGAVIIVAIVVVVLIVGAIIFVMLKKQ